jgi:hypothetical protein
MNITVHHLTASWVSSTEFQFSRHISLIFTLLSAYNLLSLISNHMPRSFPTKILYVFTLSESSNMSSLNWNLYCLEILDFRTLSIVQVLKDKTKKEHDVSETGSVSVLRWGKKPTLWGPLERASLNHWSENPISLKVIHHRQNPTVTTLLFNYHNNTDMCKSYCIKLESPCMIMDGCGLIKVSSWHLPGTTFENPSLSLTYPLHQWFSTFGILWCTVILSEQPQYHHSKTTAPLFLWHVFLQLGTF